jgi:hypothetical protein
VDLDTDHLLHQHLRLRLDQVGLKVVAVVVDLLLDLQEVVAIKANVAHVALYI